MYRSKGENIAMLTEKNQQESVAALERAKRRLPTV
jgi:hypothetical protein